MVAKKIPFAFFVLIIGIVLLFLNWIPLIGWICVMIALINGIISMVIVGAQQGLNIINIVIIVILFILVIIILNYSVNSIIFAAKQTYVDAMSSVETIKYVMNRN